MIGERRAHQINPKIIQGLENSVNTLIDIGSKRDIVQILHVTETVCPSCGYDPIRQEGLNIACQVCGGSGKVKTTHKITIPAKVFFRPTEEDLEEPGVTAQGFCKFTTDEHTAALFREFLGPRKRILINDRTYTMTRELDVGTQEFNRKDFYCTEVEVPNG